MNLLADEGVDHPIVEKLRQTGHSVLYVAEMSPGIDDDTIFYRQTPATFYFYSR
jgi:hypothetical protein